jgi:hypothetical protein
MGTIEVIHNKNAAEGVTSIPGGSPDKGIKYTVQSVIDNTLLFLRDRSTAYRLLFNQRDLKAKIVMRDFLEYSHWGETQFIENERLAERIKGRQDMILRICQNLCLSPKQLFALANNSPVPQTSEDEENDDG